jgi:flavin reductase (DIM6/NTAB) family NADH-FMN oxidoreductase RutF
MGALSAGVAIIACGEDEARAGCTASSLTSLSLAPPTLLVCLARSSSTLARLRETRAFSISLLAARHQALAHRFSGHSGVHGARRFDTAQWTTLSTGAPLLADAVAAFDCLVEEVIERHSHIILLGQGTGSGPSPRGVRDARLRHASPGMRRLSGAPPRPSEPNKSQ